MSRKMKISEFAKIFGISRRMLIHYDKIGLFSPLSVSQDNLYRYYGIEQAYELGYFMILKEAGVPLNELKYYSSHKSIENYIDLISRHYSSLCSKIEQLQIAQKKIQQDIQEFNFYQSLANKQDPFYFDITEDIPIHLIHKTDSDDLLDVFAAIYKENQSFSFRVGEIKKLQDISQKNYGKISSFFFEDFSPSAPRNCSIKKGRYIAIYHTGPHRNTPESYKKLYDYIIQNKVKTINIFYESSVIGPHCSNNEDEYVIKIFIQLSPNENR